MLSSYYDRFALNMMRTYNRTFDELTASKNEKNKTLLQNEAFNSTLIENSKHFLRMLTDQGDENQNEAEGKMLIQNLKDIFERKSLDVNVVYKRFVNHFSNKFDQKMLNVANADAMTSFKNSKAYKNLVSGLLRFKQR